MNRVLLVLALTLLAPVAANAALVAKGEHAATDTAKAEFQAGNAALHRSDYRRALADLRLSAEKGYPPAEYRLGVMYYYGSGVSKNYTTALKWYRLDAEQGDPRAEFALGVMYAIGQGVPRDYLRAYKWYQIAKANLPAQKRRYYKMVSQNVELIAPLMTPAQIAQAQQEASAYCRRYERGRR